MPSSDVQTVTQQQVERLSVGVMYLLMDKAVVDRPTSTRAAPSHVMVVYPQAGIRYLREGDRVYFPIQVSWAVWQSVVVPVLRDKSVQFRTQGNPSLRVSRIANLAHLGEWDRYLLEIRTTLMAKLVEEGYLPDTTEDADLGATEGPGTPGEPIEQALPGDSDYARTDLPDILHPDGSVKLVYETHDDV